MPTVFQLFAPAAGYHPGQQIAAVRNHYFHTYKRRMKMKKFIAMLLAVAMVMSLAACSKSTDTDTTPTTALHRLQLLTVQQPVLTQQLPSPQQTLQPPQSPK